MEWIVSNWGTMLILFLLILGLVDVVRSDKEKAKKWLLFACIEAEKLYGSKTGQVKLRYVYDWFLLRYSFLAKFISFDQFSEMVDETLTEMKHLIDTNTQVFEYVGGYEVIKK